MLAQVGHLIKLACIVRPKAFNFFLPYLLTASVKAIRLTALDGTNATQQGE